MILGDKECDKETAYFLKYGEMKHIEKSCQYGLNEDDIDYYIHDKRPDEFICWQGTQIPRWLL